MGYAVKITVNTRYDHQGKIPLFGDAFTGESVPKRSGLWEETVRVEDRSH